MKCKCCGQEVQKNNNKLPNWILEQNKRLRQWAKKVAENARKL